MTVDLITIKAPRSAAAEAFRTLRTNLMFGGQERSLHTLVVTSAARSDGKSVALANLAVTFAQSGHSTILVDADLRRPSQHEIWGMESEGGLMYMIREDMAIANPPLVQTPVANLQLLSAGTLPDIPADVLGSPRMNEIIGVLKARADYVLFDCAPVLAAADAVLLGSKVDSVLLVVRAGHTRRDHVARAKEALERVNVRLLGSVLTNAPRERIRRY